MGRKQQPPPPSSLSSSSDDVEYGRPLPPPPPHLVMNSHQQQHQHHNNPQVHICPPSQKSWFPWLVPLIFMVDVAAFVYSLYVNDCPSTSNDCILPGLGRFAFQPFSQNPLFGPSTATLEKLGALEWKLVVNEGQSWRLISCIWLHAGVVHLVANMMSLLFVGVRLEQEFGFLKIGLLFVLSGFGGSLLSSLNLRSSISVGASGALFGLLGAMLSELITNWTIYANKCAALFTLIFVIAINLAVSLLPHVDASAHIGGFLSGFLLGFVLLIRPQFGYVSRKYVPAGYDKNLLKPRHKCYQYVLGVLAFVLLIAGYVAGLVILFTGKVTHIYLPLPSIDQQLRLLYLGVAKPRKTKTKYLEAYRFISMKVARIRNTVLTFNLKDQNLSRLRK
ncbi:hypothetical protein MKX01_021649 [Papaver californicum]|nr:hypothetical protein MKX01_021649 [Papaver californicum]